MKRKSTSQTNRKKKTNRRRANTGKSWVSLQARTPKQAGEGMPPLVSFVLVLLLLGAGVFVLAKGVRWLGQQLYTENPSFIMTNMDIHAPTLTARYIMEMGDLSPENNLFSIDLKKLQTSLENIPIVKQVLIRRRLPDTLQIHVSERVAIAQVGTPYDPVPYLIDDTGLVITRKRKSELLPVIVLPDKMQLQVGKSLSENQLAVDAINAVTKCNTPLLSAILKIKHVMIDDPENLFIELHNGVRLIIPRIRMDRKLREAAAVIEKARDQGIELIEIDCTPRLNPVAKYKR